LSPKESRRVFISVKGFEKDGMTVSYALILLGLSERQTYRVKEVFKRDGIEELAHKGRGKAAQKFDTSNNL